MNHKSLIKSNIIDLDGSGIVTVAANAFGNIDSDRDISLPGSFAKTIKENFIRLKWFLNHNREQLLGVPLEVKETPEYLQFRGQLNMKKQMGRDTYADYLIYAENGLSLEHSIGVDAIKYMIDQENEVRKVSEWKLWEVSTLTSWGANERTPMLEMKGMNSLIPDLNFLKLKLKKGGNQADETFIEIEKAISRIESLINSAPDPLQPITADTLADVSSQFIKSLQLT